jgi:hypothetical protein
MKHYFSASFATVSAAAAIAAISHAASAACVGGSLLKGGFSVTIFGQLVSGGGTEGLAGVIKSNGKCGLTGTLYGNINNQAVSAASVTGSYSINADLSGSMTVAIPGYNPLTFGVNMASKDKEVLGLETDGAGFVKLDAKAQVTKTFSVASLSGKYSYICYAPDFQYQYGVDTFDGAGHGTEVNYFYGSNGLVYTVNGTFTYIVGADGSFSSTLSASGGPYIDGGALDTSSGDIQEAGITANGSAVGQAGLCVEKKQ